MTLTRRRPDPFEVIRPRFHVDVSSEGVVLICRRCGARLPFGPRYHSLRVITEAVLHTLRGHEPDATHP